MGGAAALEFFGVVDDEVVPGRLHGEVAVDYFGLEEAFIQGAAFEVLEYRAGFFGGEFFEFLGGEFTPLACSPIGRGRGRFR